MSGCGVPFAKKHIGEESRNGPDGGVWTAAQPESSVRPHPSVSEKP